MIQNVCAKKEELKEETTNSETYEYAVFVRILTVAGCTDVGGSRTKRCIIGRGKQSIPVRLEDVYDNEKHAYIKC